MEKFKKDKFILDSEFSDLRKVLKVDLILMEIRA